MSGHRLRQMKIEDRAAAVAWAREVLEDERTAILDSETTSLYPPVDFVEIGVIDRMGRQIFHSRIMLRNILEAISESGKGLPRGRYVKLLHALAESERKGMPTGKTVAEILPEKTLRTGSLLRWAERLGLAEKFEGAPPGAPKTCKTTWLITDEGRALIEGRGSLGGRAA